MKLAVVVQRYGAQINGGAELHARYIVELLAKQHQVDVLTTCARDYVTWKDEYPEGTETVRGVKVRRFRVARERDVEDFGRRSHQVFEQRHSLADEIAWLESEGPTSPALIEFVRTHANDYDYIFFFSYRYYHAYHGVRAVPGKAILVPTAERDATIGLSVFGPIFRGVRAIMYNSHEERAMIQAATKNTHVPGVVVGIGSDVPRNPVASRFRRKFNIHDPFIIYVGRIDENKGCRELFTNFTSYRPRLGQRLKLVLIGNSILPIPDHPNVHHLGFVSDQDKFDAIAAADALIMPSFYESLSMVALEAWALGRPVLANGRCDVLRGQCIRSRAGLYYDSFEEFAETLFTLTSNRGLAEGLGDNGRHYFETHYAWSVIERKYSDILRQLAQEDASGSSRKSASIEPLPGWLTRRRKTLPAAADVLKGLPKGAAVAGSGGGSGSGHGAGSGSGAGTGAGDAGAGSSGGGDALSTDSGAGGGRAPISLEPSRAGSHATMARPEGGASSGMEGRREDGRREDGRGEGGRREGRSDRGERGGRGDRRSRGDRGERGARGGDRGDRGERGDRGNRERGERDGNQGEQGERGERTRPEGRRDARDGRDARGSRDRNRQRDGNRDRDRSRDGSRQAGEGGRSGEGDRSGEGRSGEGRSGDRSGGGNGERRDHERRDSDRRDADRRHADRRDAERGDGERRDAESRDTRTRDDEARERGPREGAPRDRGQRDDDRSDRAPRDSDQREPRESGRSDGDQRDAGSREGDQRDAGRRDGDGDRGQGPRPPRREGGGGGHRRRRPRDGRPSGPRGGR